MKPHARQLLACAAIAATLLPLAASALPIQFSELSLMVRARESETSIQHEISERKLAQKLTADQEAKLKKDGASDSLISTLRTATVVAAAPVAAIDGRGPASSGDYEAAGIEDVSLTHGPSRAHKRGMRGGIEIVDIGVGEPVNLSAWGGVDREFVFSRRSITDLRRTYSFYEQNNFPFYRDPLAEPTLDDVTMVEPIGTWTHTSTYLGTAASQPFLDAYTASTAHTFTRPIEVQRHNPVFVPGLPYSLYPVYGGGGVSLYYIGRISEDVVRLAVISQWQ